MKDKILALKAKKISKMVAADLLGMSHCKFTRLLTEYEIDWPNQLQAQRVEWQGVFATFAEHGHRSGISPSTLTDRWRRTGTLDRSTPLPITRRQLLRFMVYRRRGLAAWDAAQRVGYHYNQLHKLSKKAFGQVYTDIVKQATRVRRSRSQLQ